MSRVDLEVILRDRLAGENRSAQVSNIGDGLARRQTVGDVDDLALGVAVHEQIGLGIEQNRAADLLGPVIKVRNAT